MLLSAVVFFAAAYRFDNRFVLSLALSTLAAWFGIKLSRFGFRSADSLRVSALVYGALVAGTGIALQRLDDQDRISSRRICTSPRRPPSSR